ncbi:MAG TPA: hypothetical protein VGI60_00030 [Chthoniobacterales bacterium]|jgi:hypothetical protein
MDLILRKSVQMARVSGYGSLVLGVLFIALALYGHHVLPQMPVIHPFVGAFGVLFILLGLWYRRVGSKKQ